MRFIAVVLPLGLAACGNSSDGTGGGGTVGDAGPTGAPPAASASYYCDTTESDSCVCALDPQHKLGPAAPPGTCPSASLGATICCADSLAGTCNCASYSCN